MMGLSYRKKLLFHPVCIVFYTNKLLICNLYNLNFANYNLLATVLFVPIVKNKFHLKNWDSTVESTVLSSC
jgi:hypothetical protein